MFYSLLFFFALFVLSDVVLSDTVFLSGQLTCNGIAFVPFVIELYEEDSGYFFDRHDLLANARLNPLKEGEFAVEGTQDEAFGSKFNLAIDHNCRKYISCIVLYFKVILQ